MISYKLLVGTSPNLEHMCSWGQIDFEVKRLEVKVTARPSGQMSTLGGISSPVSRTHVHIFTVLRGMQTQSSDENSVCLSVCQSNASIVTK